MATIKIDIVTISTAKNSYVDSHSLISNNNAIQYLPSGIKKVVTIKIEKMLFFSIL